MHDINQLVELAVRRVDLLSKSVDAKIIKTFENKENIMLLAKERNYKCFC